MLTWRQDAAQTTAAIERLISLENEVANLQQKRLEVKRQLGLLQQFLEGKQSVSQEAFYVEDPSPQLAKLTARFRDLSLRREVLLKVAWQYNWRDGGRVRREGLVAAQVMVWF